MKPSETEKSRARGAVRRAINQGKIVRPDICDECGMLGPVSSDGRSTIHAHHYLGYERQLDIKWLCPTCHFVEDPRPRREKNGRSILTEKDVAEIRRRYKPAPLGWVGRYHGRWPHSARTIAKEFGVSQATIDRIVRNVNWIDEALK